jgi:hypothetical protein
LIICLSSSLRSKPARYPFTSAPMSSA